MAGNVTLSAAVSTSNYGSYSSVHTITSSDDKAINGWAARASQIFTVTGNVGIATARHHRQPGRLRHGPDGERSLGR